LGAKNLAIHQTPAASNKPKRKPPNKTSCFIVKKEIKVVMIGTVNQIIKPHFHFQTFSITNSLPHSAIHHWH